MISRRSFLSGALALPLIGALPLHLEARRLRHRKWPYSGASLDLDFINQRYWWNYRERQTSEFTTYTLNSSTFDRNGLTPTATIDVTVAIAGTGFTLPGTMIAIVIATSNAAGGSARTPVVLDDGTAANSVSFNQNAANGNLTFNVLASSATQAAIAPPIGTRLNAPTAIAASADTNSFLFSHTGRAATADVSGTLPTVPTLRIGKNFSASTQFAGAIARVVLIPRAMTQAELNEVTIRLMTTYQ